MLQNLSTLMVYVREMPLAVSFYRDALGLPLRMESPGWSEFDLGNGVILGLHAAGERELSPAPGWIPGFRVASIRQAHDRLAGGGNAIVQGFHDIPGGVVIEVADPDGNLISLEQSGISCAELGVASAV